MKPLLMEMNGVADGTVPGPEGGVGQWLRSLYREHWQRCVAYLTSKYGPGPPDPEDCTQQAFVHLARMDKTVMETITSPKSFLYRAAENVLISEKRREVTRRRHAQEVLATSTTSEFFEGFVPSPERVLINREELVLIESAIVGMPPRRQLCFTLHRFEDMSFADIARRLGISQTAVRRHCERALADIEAAVLGEQP